MRPPTSEFSECNETITEELQEQLINEVKKYFELQQELFTIEPKKKILDLKRVEVEKRITQDEYVNYLMEADNNLHPIHKTRYCLTENNQYFEIDIYPEWDKQAIMEIELNSEDEKILKPSCIKILKEVTKEQKYFNHNLAKDMPKQLIKNNI